MGMQKNKVQHGFYLCCHQGVCVMRLLTDTDATLTWSVALCSPVDNVDTSKPVGDNWPTLVNIDINSVNALATFLLCKSVTVGQ